MMVCLNWPLFLPCSSASIHFLFPPLHSLPSFQMAATPPTSHSTRPTTSRRGIDPPTDTYSDRDPQYTYSQEYTIEEDEESEDEDVFAFLPPSTAEHSPPIQLPTHLASLSHPPPPPHEYPQYFSANDASPTSPPPPFSAFASPLAYPPPTFIPPTPTHNIPQAGPSTTSVHFVGTVDSPSPPSTAEHHGSHSMSVEDGFRLRKLGGLRTSISVTSGFTTTSSQVPPDYKRRSTLFHEKRQPSTALSDFSTTDPELDSSSIRYVQHIFIPLLLTRFAG